MEAPDWNLSRDFLLGKERVYNVNQPILQSYSEMMATVTDEGNEVNADDGMKHLEERREDGELPKQERYIADYFVILSP